MLSREELEQRIAELEDEVIRLVAKNRRLEDELARTKKRGRPAKAKEIQA